MANDSFDINISGIGAGSGGNLPPIDTTAFQANIKLLANSLKDAAQAAESYTKRMRETERQISEFVKKGLSSSGGSASTDIKRTVASERDSLKSNNQKLFSGIDRLSSSIDKLASKITDINKTENRSKPNESNDRTLKDVKTILAAVGIGSIIKQITDANVIAPARASGMLIGSNVLSNPTQIGSNLIQSFQQNTAATGTALSTGLGALLGFGLGGGIVGADIGGRIGGYVANLYGQNNIATEIPIQQRSLSQDFYANISRQQPRFGAFGQSQYSGGLGSVQAFNDPYFESKNAFGRSFSRYSNQFLNPSTTEGIASSMSSLGMGSNSELSTLGSSLGQIAKFTSKTSEGTDKVYQSLERTGVSPIEGAQRILGLLQSGMSVSQAQRTLQNTANATDTFSQGQASYFGQDPLNRFRAQLVSPLTGINPEKLFSGDKGEIAKLRSLSTRANNFLSNRTGGTVQDLIRLHAAEQFQHITPGMLSDGTLTPGHGFLQQSPGAMLLVNKQRNELIRGANGRDPSQILEQTLTEIGRSTNNFSALNAALEPLIQTLQQDYNGSIGKSVVDATKFFFSTVTSKPGVPR